MDKAQVIIVGAGLAGLLAARELTRQQQDFLLLEAQLRLGGRVKSGVADNAANCVDLGPTWLFPHQARIQRLAKNLNLTLFTQYTSGDVLYQDLTGVTRFSGAPAPLSYRVAGGVGGIIDALVAQISTERIRLSHPVTYLTRNADHWQLNVNGRCFYAQALILAIPPRMIMQYLTPHLWASEALCQQLAKVPTWMAAQAKFVVQYDRPFWREQGLSGQAMSRTGPMVELHDACDGRSSSALFGFIGVPATTRAQYSAEQLEQACLTQLVALYGEQAKRVSHYVLEDWAKNQWLSAPSDIIEPAEHPYLDLTAFAAQLDALALKLVASEVAIEDAGYLEGAIDAVERALSVDIE